MEIIHARTDIRNSMATIQLLRLACPKCNEPVQYAICDDDRLYREDAKYYEARCEEMLKEIKRLHGLMDTLAAKVR